MQVNDPETRALVLVRGGRNDAPGRPMLPEPVRPAQVQITTEEDGATLLAAELRLVIVARASSKRLRPPAILYAVARVLGMLAATAVRDRDRLDRLVDELHDQVRAAADQTFGRGTVPR